MASILIVEDNPDNMKLFKAVLGLRRHKLTGLAGGEDLLESLRKGRFDLVLLDIQLPGKDGYALIEDLRAAGVALPPVVALTAHAMAGDRERAQAAGFDGYLTKPINVATFGGEVEAFLRKS